MSVFTELRNVLANLYPDESSTQRIVEDAGLALTQINFRGKPIDDWHGILQEATKTNKIDDLLNCALKEYGANLALRQAVEAYQAEQARVGKGQVSISMPSERQSTVALGSARVKWIMVTAGIVLAVAAILLRLLPETPRTNASQTGEQPEAMDVLTHLPETPTTDASQTVSLTHSLVAHYPFDGNAEDASGKGYNGTVYGDAELGRNRWGVESGAYCFKGEGYIDVGHVDWYSTEQWTWTAWVNTEIDAGMPDDSQMILAHGGVARAEIDKQNGAYINIFYGRLYATVFAMEDGEKKLKQAEGDREGFRASRWQHVAAVQDDAMLKLYRNGKLEDVAEVDDLIPPGMEDTLMIGGWREPNGNIHQPWYGCIEEIYIYSRALNDAEISELAKDGPIRGS